MEKLIPEKPVLVMLYGFPGAGKTYFARQFGEDVQAAHLEQDRIRFELFEKPRYSKQEDFALNRIMEYMTGEFLNAGVSVIYDMNAIRVSQRRHLRELARKHKAQIISIWFQLDADTAFMRNFKRDRRRTDDRFAAGYDVEPFKEFASHMQQPEMGEDFLVVSGKHTYQTQRSSIIKRMSDLQIIRPSEAMHKMVKPDLVNLVPSGQKEAPGHKNIVLR